ncbi:hypothetical protein SPRG_01297 [Saprolegnia parasitica CBS 223.65]|uniref:WRKY19-like zinc finger domain-containing protein n=1 Tax=Saprolegnia parasitica (strain CBS 223.65) TaxID=695850 RepID=A0A067CU22_SAPPC|nr:hypothetical protein SPRG_01297 [Saprolegnia parasitica CBS 223.65]KDO34023.1 hypothetical protein SPRG_01297 [Saprolegnia parasitica CBS 223.65]|eukprot:XP_012194908.1 hypothetical protein SPRG_01297 [Saprolegnia parasitica CBS 223.65]
MNFQGLHPEAPAPCSYHHNCYRYAKLNDLCLIHARTLHVASPTSTKSASETGSEAAKPTRTNRHRKCQATSCTAFARHGGFCTRHGGGRRCKIDGCETAAQTRGFCRLHGGGSRCRVANCNDFARVGGLCMQHVRMVNRDAMQQS